MGDCWNCNKVETEKYEDLKYRYDKLQDSYENLKNKLIKTEDNLDSANYRISTELEPRIKRDHDSYDNWVTSGGGNFCFNMGINGKCGLECEKLGEKSLCSEVVSEIEDEELLNHYAENDAFEGRELIRIELIERGLSDKVKEIDDEYCDDVIASYEKQIANLKALTSWHLDIKENGFNNVK